MATAPQGPWWRELNGYMWWVFIVAAMGWVFDVMDQRLFTLSREFALDELLSVEVDEGALMAMTAAEAAALLGLDPGDDPRARVAIEDPGDENKRGVLILPPLAAADSEARPPAPRRLPFVRSPSAPGRLWILPTSDWKILIGRVATAVFLIGWATGGVFFGILGDKWGRAFTMMLTILIYSLFTGLSALSVSWWDYSAYRFMTGLGVGGEFAAGAAFVAEVMPARARPYALGLLQSFSALGNILGSLIGRFVLQAERHRFEWEDWRQLYLIGILPALLVVVIRWRLKEPERWREAKESAVKMLGKELGAFGDLFQPRWRSSVFFGTLFGITGVIGLWGIGFWTPELIGKIVPPEGSSDVKSSAFALQDVGAFFGISAMTLFTQGAPRWRAGPYFCGLLAAAAGGVALVNLGAGHAESPGMTALLGVDVVIGLHCLLAMVGALSGGLGRRASFGAAFAMALVATLVVFRYMHDPGQIYWMIPVLGFSTLLCFGMYAIYFPELYPTRLRSTGTGFCYNVARYVAAGGIFLMSAIPLDFRTSAQVFALIYIVGILAAPFAPETKDKPLEE